MAAPQVGDALLLDGIGRVITEIKESRGKVFFSNPPSAPQFDESGKRVNRSLAGSCALAELQEIPTPNGSLWVLPGRVERPKVNPDAVQLEAAEFRINGA